MSDRLAIFFANERAAQRRQMGRCSLCERKKQYGKLHRAIDGHGYGWTVCEPCAKGKGWEYHPFLGGHEEPPAQEEAVEADDQATADFFQPRAEQATLFDNSVTHLPEPPTVLPVEKIDVRETVKRRAAAKRSHAKWFADTFCG